MKAYPTRKTASGFTFVEALMTIAILGIMAAVLISAFSSTAQDSNRMIARQQQAAVQAAVNCWVNGDSNRVNTINATTGTAKLRTIEEIRADWNSRVTSLARLNVVAPYLDPTTVEHLTDRTVNTGRIKSDALSATKQHLALPDWAANSFPKVELNTDP